MSAIDDLVERFVKFPGVGPRQARRFVYFLLGRSNGFMEELAGGILELKKHIKVCRSCWRFFPSDFSGPLCLTCSDPERETGALMVVERDVDLENVEKSRVFRGKYFVLGGTLPILEKHPESKIRSKELFKAVKERAQNSGLSEVILAMSATTEGEHTADYILNILHPHKEKYGLKLTQLGRGLSTGTEIEYSDADTIRNALKNRQ